MVVFLEENRESFLLRHGDGDGDGDDNVRVKLRRDEMRVVLLQRKCGITVELDVAEEAIVVSSPYQSNGS